MKKALIGSGGFAREIKHHMNCDLTFFVDDPYWVEGDSNLLPLSSFNPNEYEVLVAIGNPLDRYNVVNRLPKETKYFSFIHPSAIILDDSIKIGEGSIICAGSILTTNIKIGKHTHINLQTTIGHDCVIGDWTLYSRYSTPETCLMVTATRVTSLLSTRYDRILLRDEHMVDRIESKRNNRRLCIRYETTHYARRKATPFTGTPGSTRNKIGCGYRRE